MRTSDSMVARLLLYRCAFLGIIVVYWYKAMKKVHIDENNKSVNSLTYNIVFLYKPNGHTGHSRLLSISCLIM